MVPAGIISKIMSLERFALTGSPPLLPGLQVVPSAFEGVTEGPGTVAPLCCLSHCPCPSPEPAARELSVSVTAYWEGPHPIMTVPRMPSTGPGTREERQDPLLGLQLESSVAPQCGL